MKKNIHLKSKLLTSHFRLHLIVLIYGFTAILGKLITLPAIQLVWYRMAIALIAFSILIKWTKTDLKVSKKEFYKLIGIGMLVAIHWLAFFGAVKIANVSVALGCLATSTFFTSILEPLFFRKKINPIEVIIGLLILIGIYLIFRFEINYALGIVVGLSAALLAGLFSVLNKKLIGTHKATVISFYEMLGGVLLITAYTLLIDPGEAPWLTLSWTDFIYLLALGVVCTAYAFAAQVELMKHLSAYVVALAINLEPVYGIIMAWLIFGESEHMTNGFYAGTGIILTSVLGYPLYHYYLKRQEKTIQTR